MRIKYYEVQSKPHKFCAMCNLGSYGVTNDTRIFAIIIRLQFWLRNPHIILWIAC